jgi:hypothetical protein
MLGTAGFIIVMERNQLVFDGGLAAAVFVGFFLGESKFLDQSLKLLKGFINKFKFFSDSKSKFLR